MHFVKNNFFKVRWVGPKINALWLLFFCKVRCNTRNIVFENVEGGGRLIRNSKGKKELNHILICQSSKLFKCLLFTHPTPFSTNCSSSKVLHHYNAPDNRSYATQQEIITFYQALSWMRRQFRSGNKVHSLQRKIDVSLFIRCEVVHAKDMSHYATSEGQ